MNYKLLTVIAFFFILVIIALFLFKQPTVLNDINSDNLSWNRKIISCSQDKCTVQDYIEGGEKLTDPFIIHKDHIGSKEYPEYFDTQGINRSPIIGKVIVWYPSGEKFSEQNFDEKGNYEGRQVFWYKNGQKAHEMTYHQGLLDGVSLTWYPNGQQATLVSAKQGKYISGVNWYDNGIKKLEYSFQPSRINKFWYENGLKKSYVYYKDNVYIKTDNWDKQGHKKTEYNTDKNNSL